MIKQAVILCGGRATRLNDSARYQPAIETPKPLIEVGGMPFVTYSMRWLEGVGVEDIYLLVLHMKDEFDSLLGWFPDKLTLVESTENPDEVILGLKSLEGEFFLLNGDCYPVMDWRAFLNANKPRVAVKPVGRDAGCAIVKVGDIEDKAISCQNIAGMRSLYQEYMIEGGLHIGTQQGLQRARMYMDIVVFGQ